MAKQQQNALLVILIYAPWCGYSQQFLPDFDLLARNMHKDGEKDLFFVKIDGDKEVELSHRYGIDGFPTVFLHQIVNGEVRDKILYEGERYASHLLHFIRQIKPLSPEIITNEERYNNLRNQLTHHLVLGIFNQNTRKFVRDIFMKLQEANQNVKFAYVEDSSLLPEKIRNEAKSDIIVVKNPIVEDYFLLSNVQIGDDFESANENLKKALKGKIDFMDLVNINLYASFERPIVAIATTHPSVHDIEKNQDFYKVIVKFIYEGGYKNHPEYDFVILNAIDIKDVSYDLQFDQVENRNFYLIILQDGDTGYRYDNIIIREDEDQPLVRTADTINQYLNDYKNGRLRPYLKSESKSTEPAYNNGILQVFGSNFIDLVKKKKQEKPMFLMFTRMNCPTCDKLDVYFERLQQEFPHIQFARMDVDRNYPTADLRQIIYDEQMPQFFMVYSNSKIDRFHRIHDTYQEMRDFLDQVKKRVDELRQNDEL